MSPLQLVFLLAAYYGVMTNKQRLLTSFSYDIYAVLMLQSTMTVLEMTALGWLMLQPSYLRSLRLPPRKRRFWSSRLQEDTKKEASFGVWEQIILEKCVRLRIRGCPDSEDKYYVYLFRMDRAAFNELYQKYGKYMARGSTNFRETIPAKKRMAIFLAWLAHGYKQNSLSVLFDVSQPVISTILRDGIEVFKELMVPDEIKLPAGEQLRDVMDGFEAEAGMPNCIGAVDGTFFHMRQPSEWGDAYWCYKNFYGILVLAICDSNYIFTWASSGQPGSVGDAAVWNNSDYKAALVGGLFDLPDGEAPVAVNGVHIPTYVVADAAFALHSRVMKGFTPAIGSAQECFNAAIVRTRRDRKSVV